MQNQAAQPGGLISYIVPIIVVIIVMALRMRRMRNLRPLRLETLWIVPVLYGAVVTMLFVTHPPTVVGWALVAVALLAGGALGWQRGKLMEIHVDPETHELGQKASLAGMLFLVSLIAVRYVARMVGGDFHMDVNALVNTLAALALGMFTMQRIEMYLRAKRLLEEARASRAS
ncbi:CcdC protein domain-containing protein [Croceibacterium aestuarii]|uniref:CcdC protein domain-containing protein n=1 Tax=Croceibacterium aestuarii TaxID=3064139 RepID=UPI00272E6944|nr:CcdC protein domain-containing protein [Croceibacterium sp. D39]